MQQPTDPNSQGKDFAAALRDDACRIRAGVPADFERRIDAALARARPVASGNARRGRRARPWIVRGLASLASLGIAALVVLLVGQVDNSPPPSYVTPDSSVAELTPEYPRLLAGQAPLRVQTAALTAPLEKELRNLESDIGRARENLERDLRLTF